MSSILQVTTSQGGRSSLLQVREASPPSLPGLGSLLEFTMISDDLASLYEIFYLT